MAAKLKDLGKILRSALTSKRLLEAVGKSATRSIKKRTRVGKGVKENLDGPHKLPQLKSKTVSVRKSLKRSGRLSGKAASPTKSNVTRSGDMVDSIEFAVGKSKIEIKLGSSEQETKAERLLDINSDYQFMRISKQEFKRAVQSATKLLEQILKRINFTEL